MVGLLALARLNPVLRSMGKTGASAEACGGAALGSWPVPRIPKQRLSPTPRARQQAPAGFFEFSTGASLQGVRCTCSIQQLTTNNEQRATCGRSDVQLSLGLAFGLSQSDRVACTACPSAISPCPLAMISS